MKQLLPKLLNRSYSLLFILSFLLSSLGWGQNLNMQNGSFTLGTNLSCGGMFYDSGGAGAAGAADENFTVTICPQSDQFAQIVFSSVSYNNSGNGANQETFQYSLNGGSTWTTISSGTTPTINGASAGSCIMIRYIENGTYATTTNWVATMNCLPSCPPVPGYSLATVGHISNVNVNSGAINQSSGWSGGLNTYTSSCATLIAGQTYPFSFTFTYNGVYTAYRNLWIDWNGNGTYETSEMISLGSGTSTITVPQSITVPCDAVPGTIRFRVVFQYNTNPTSPCTTNSSYGETEEYCLTILPNVTVNAGSDITLAACSNTYGLSASPAVGYWSVEAGSATLSSNTSPTATATISGTSATLQWNVAGTGGCTAYTYSDQIVISTNGLPSVANAGANQSICGSSATLAGNVPTVGTGTWSYFTTPASGPAPTYAPNANTAGATVSNLGQGYTYSFIWSTSNAACPATIYRDTMTIFNQATPTINSPANNNQTVCVGNAIAPIVYTLGGGATGATVTGLPPGVNYSYSGGILTISGTPTNNAASPYNYTVTTKPTGPCAPIIRTGTITVNGPTISSPANMNQSVCVGTAMTAIVFATSGATGATVTGLPSGVTGTYSAGTGNFTISGTPSVVGPFNYTVTTTGGCGPISRMGTITVNPTANAGTISGTSPICQSTQFTTVGTVLGGGTGVWSSSNTSVATVSNTGFVSVVAAGTCTITFQITGGCGGVQTTTYNLTVTTPYDLCSCAGVLTINAQALVGTIGNASVGLEAGESECTPNAGFTSDQQTNWYQFTATEACQGITVAPTNNICAGMLKAGLYSGTCGSMTLIECKTAGSGGGAQLYFNRCDFVPGETYYVQLSQYSGTACSNDVDYIIAWQTIDNDMCTARQICDFTTSLVSYNTGPGNDIDLNATNRGCITYGERAPNWFVFQAQTTGTIGLEVDVLGSGDYDFAIWGPYFQLQSDCPTVNGPTNLPTRCSSCASASNFTLVASSTDTAEYANPCDHSLALLNVVENGIYYLLINNYQYSPDEFILTWSGTADLNCGTITSLPIELSYFGGEAIDRYNHLYWTTSSEINNAYFTVERSLDGELWEYVGTVQGAGNSQYMINYSLIDNEPGPRVSYYRLKQTDFDGQTKSSNIISIARDFDADGLFSDIYPNPTTDVFNVVYMGRDYKNPIMVSIYDYTGKLVKTIVQEEISNNLAISIDTELLPTGMYQVVLSQGDQKEIKRLSVIH